MRRTGLSRGHGGAGLCKGDLSAGLVFVCLNGDWFEIFGFEDLPAIEALHVIDTIAPGDDCCLFMLTGCSHTENWDTNYSNDPGGCVKRPLGRQPPKRYTKL